ncbi:MAG: hypothetical protein LLG40_13340 [Deltaproteobacteria bacterium]|nr:hypothetical protein [Deltaproteobacteria bacterium]
MAIRLSTGMRNGLVGTQGIKEMFQGGFIGIFSGAQPADPNQAETGSLLAVVSSSSGTNGIGFGTEGSGALPKDSGIWSGIVGTAGVAGWFRLYSADKPMGSNGTACRMDGNVGVSGADLAMANTNLELGATVTLDSATFTEPAS